MILLVHDFQPSMECFLVANQFAGDSSLGLLWVSNSFDLTMKKNLVKWFLTRTFLRAEILDFLELLLRGPAWEIQWILLAFHGNHSVHYYPRPALPFCQESVLALFQDS